jgi:hypothetical protein
VPGLVGSNSNSNNKKEKKTTKKRDAWGGGETFFAVDSQEHLEWPCIYGGSATSSNQFVFPGASSAMRINTACSIPYSRTVLSEDYFITN